MLFSSHNDKVIVHDNATASDIADHLRMPIYAIKIVTLFVMYSFAYNELLRWCKILHLPTEAANADREKLLGVYRANTLMLTL